LLEASFIPIPDPINALTVEMAAMVASGRMTPEEAKFLKYDKEDETISDSSDDDSDGDYDSDDSEYDSDEDEDN
jgi:hypothetical protein